MEEKLSELSQAVLNLYNTGREKKVTSFKEIEEEFARIKVTEPLVHSSRLYGKVPTNAHILDGDFPDDPISANILADVL